MSADTQWMQSILDPAAPGAFVADWHTKAPDPVKYEPYKGAKNLDEFMSVAEKRVADAQTAMRQRTVKELPPRPADDAAPEAWNEYRTARNLPMTVDEYGITNKPDSLPDELWSPDEAKAFAEFAHKSDMPAETARSIAEWYREKTKSNFEAHRAAMETAEKELRDSEAVELNRRYGAKLDGTLKDVRQAAKDSGVPEEFFDPASKQFVGVHLTGLVADMLARAPRGEDGTSRKMGNPSQGDNYTLEWAKAILQPGHPDNEALTNRSHPRHAEVIAARNRVYAAG